MKHQKTLWSVIKIIGLIAVVILCCCLIGYRAVHINEQQTKTVAQLMEETNSDQVTVHPQGVLVDALPPILDPHVTEMPDGTQVYSCSVIAVGDNLYHQAVINSGIKEDGSADYKEIYEFIKPTVQAADLAICDQETILTENINEASGYPRFATPVQAADALVDTGFDVVYSATNHADDYGEEGVLNTIRYWKDNYPEITLLGIHDSPEDADTIKIREVNGIRFAFLDYTYGTNSAGFEGDKSYLLDVFSDGSTKISQMISKAKSEADCVIFIGHWGDEGEPMPTEFEKEWVTFLMHQGVDVCIGGHPHNLQPYTWIYDDSGHRMLVFYSLGNFVSNMDHLLEVLEGMGCFTVQKTVDPDGSSSITVTDAAVRPLIMHYDPTRTYFRVYLLEDYTPELASQHGINLQDSSFSLDRLYRKFDEIMFIQVEPSTDTLLLNVKQLWDGTLLDPEGNTVTKPVSLSEFDYYNRLGIDIRDTSAEYDYKAAIEAAAEAKEVTENTTETTQDPKEINQKEETQS